ncbi:glutathione S-transferase [Echria macrotheca]|uniref:Glutathione S-transferase n=1 Tax=Echria macrotheca TaxID=438768 RepID=A0AAJ0B964_9PEZI|nr:glutathione S-transferase [Echria macrotheca]
MTLTVHHLNASQSERILWLCEELGLPYDLKLYQRTPILAPPEYKKLHPAGTAPIIQDGDLTLAESAACIEYISHRHAAGRLFVPPSAPAQAYADFLYWFHWSNGTFQPTLTRALLADRAGVAPGHPALAMTEERMRSSLGELETRLGEKDYLAGDELTAADIMTVWSLTTMRLYYPLNLGGYPNILAYLERIGKREAYRRAMAKGDPGMELGLGAEPPRRK